MKLKRTFCLILCLILPVVLFACKNDTENTETNKFNIKETQNFITKTYTAQDEFFKALYDESDNSNDSGVVGSTLNAVSELLDNYSMLVLVTDSDGKSVIEQIENGFVYNKNNEEISVVMANNTLFVKLKNKSSNVKLKVKYINNSSYAITIFDEQELNSLLVYFTGTTGRVKCNTHTTEIVDIFSIEDFSSFARDDKTGSFLSNE